MQFANIEWREDSECGYQLLPYSIDFNDIYFNSTNGILETEYVFIEHNRLKERFATLKDETFTIIETGFGTGLNFYCAATHFLALAPAEATLHYISIEKFPLAPFDMHKASMLWPALSKVSEEFLSTYVNLKAGLNEMSIAESRIQLALQANDILSALPQVSQKADAWFLDGFAPAKNAEMWSDEVFAQMEKLSKKGTTFATFTSAGGVRRGLQNAGFEVEKYAGFGKKREMLFGKFA